MPDGAGVEDRGSGGPGLLRLALVPAVALAIMVSSWPWVRLDPAVNIVKAFRAAASFHATYPVLFAGSVVSSAELPRVYLPWYLLITTPPVTLLLAGVGLTVMVAGMVRRRRDRESWLAAMTLLWVSLPVLLVVVKRPNLYDGIRHFLFLLPALALVAAWGGAWLVDRFRGRGRHAAAVLVVLAALTPVRDLVALHPYQYTCFNSLAGGLAGAWRRYETDYWVTSYREAAEWLNVRARETPGGRLTVLLAANEYCRLCAEHYLEPGIEVFPVFSGREEVPEVFDYYVATRRYRLDRLYPDLPVVHVIGRRGAVFTVIKTGPARQGSPVAGRPSP